MAKKALELLPELEGKELSYIQAIFDRFDEKQSEVFSNAYRAQRKSQQDVMIFCIVGLFIVPGLQRFILGQIGMGVLYFFTIGLCFIGSIVDLVNHKDLAFEYNKKIADQLVVNV